MPTACDPCALGARLLLVQLQRRGIDAVALARRARAVGEEVSEVAAAVRTQDLRPDHPVARVRLLLDRLLGRRCEERRPAAPGVVLRLRAEELSAAAGADVLPRLEDVVVLARERRLGALLAQDVVLLGRELGPPLAIGLLDL